VTARTIDTAARAAFREVMATFPSGATIVTTVDPADRWWGFTATSFCSVSIDPPLVLFCLARSAQCHPAFQRATRWAVHIVGRDHAELAMRFADRGADKFAGAGFVSGTRGVPVLPDVCAILECSRHAQYPGGDHTILVGRVDAARVGTGQPVTYVRRAFHDLPASSSAVDAP
jgi:flavin reductase ActVB